MLLTTVSAFVTLSTPAMTLPAAAKALRAESLLWGRDKGGGEREKNFTRKGAALFESVLFERERLSVFKRSSCSSDSPWLHRRLWFISTDARGRRYKGTEGCSETR